MALSIPDKEWIEENMSGGGGSSTHIYSTEPQKIGVWIDGSDIYEKVFEFTSQGVQNGRYIALNGVRLSRPEVAKLTLDCYLISVGDECIPCTVDSDNEIDLVVFHYFNNYVQSNKLIYRYVKKYND